MSLEELKAEANKLGYRLAKKPEPNPRREPCPCGTRRRLGYWTESSTGFGLVCLDCGREGAWGRNYRDAVINWNNAVKGGETDERTEVERVDQSPVHPG